MILNRIDSSAGYSQCVVTTASRVAYVAGQVALDEHGHVIGKGDIRKQTKQTFSNLGKLLNEMNADWGQICELHVYLVNRDDLPGFIEGFRERFSSHPPAATLLVVNELFMEDLLVEVTATVTLDD